MKVHICAEAGINHNADINIALQMIEAAWKMKVDSIKWQARTPSISVPLDQRDIPRETPWGTMSYLEYKEKMEFDMDQWDELFTWADKISVPMAVSVWDIPAAEKMRRFDMPYVKVPSAAIVNLELLEYLNTEYSCPVVLSTGMSTMEQVRKAESLIDDPIILHCTSAYPCPPEQLNLNLIETLHMEFPDARIGYSGHEVGLAPSLAAVALGATWIERHFTLDRSMWGTDQAASVEVKGFERLVKDIRLIETAMGDGKKRIEDSEIPIMRKLRG